MSTTFQSQQQLTSTTAPGKVFGSRNELADHYKSDWHKYNLKRREAGLPLLLEADFQARLAAALSLRQEEGRNGTSHLKKGKKQKPKKNIMNQKEVAAAAAAAAAAASKDENDKEAPADTAMELDDNATDQQVEEEKEELEDKVTEEAMEDAPVIDPKQCLFDRHFSATVEANADRMYRKYGFFVPDREYLTDLEGLIGYCHEKIKLGHMCVYCHKAFPTWQGCQKHMISKRHTKLKYEAGIDLEDLSVFYDFTEADNEFMQSIGATNVAMAATVSKDNEMTTPDEEKVVMADDGDDDWEDISDDEEMADEDGADDDTDNDIYDAYEMHLAQYGFDVNALGELILPNGRVIGHRALSRYYKQRVPTAKTNQNSALVAARRAAGERLFNGQVINIHGTSENSMALMKAGVHPNVAAGRAGNGILTKNEAGMYSSMSIYRFRAAARKARREEFQGVRLYEKSKQNMNRMDKKANRLMNGVSVAHAKR